MTTPLPSTHRSEAAQALEMVAYLRQCIPTGKRLLHCRPPAKRFAEFRHALYWLQLAHQHIQAAPRLP